NMKAQKVTVTTVGVATHGAPEDQKLKGIADATGGRVHKVTNPKALPAIYINETPLVSQSVVHAKPVKPNVLIPTGPTENLAQDLNNLHGFVRTSLKQSPLVEMQIEGPRLADMQFPVLATWNYGLGKSAAFTSDARSLPEAQKRGWDWEWAGSD